MRAVCLTRRWRRCARAARPEMLPRACRLKPHTQTYARPRLTQCARMLSRPRRPGSHPLRALRTGAARPALPAREWAAVSCYADPVDAVTVCAWAIDAAIWQWAPVPASFARAVLGSGALRHIRRVVELGAANAGRCAEPG